MKMTLNAQAVSDRQSSSTSDTKSASPNTSPRSSPRPSPRPQTKREHNKSDSQLNVSFIKDAGGAVRFDSSPVGSPELSSSLRSTTNELLPPPDFNRSDSGGSTTKDRKDGRSKKKSAWYSVLYPTYKSRSEDYKRIFKDVPDEERLVVDYSSALQKEILVHGRLYVSQNYLCFYANIFGWETNVTIRWKDVSAITKEKTALVIPNAILIMAKNEKYFFTSFVARDKTYMMLFRVWQNALLDQPMSSQEMWQWVHQCYGDELGLTSDDEDYIAPGIDEDKLSGRLSIESFQEECAINSQDNQENIMVEKKVRNGEEDLKEMNPQETEESSQNNSAMPPTDLSDSSESEAEKIDKRDSGEFVPATFKSFDTHPCHSSSDEKLYPVCSELHDGRQMLNEVYPIHIDQLFTLLFTTSKFFLDFHASRKTSDILQTSWSHNVIDNTKIRTLNLTVPLSQPLAPKSAQVTEKQTMLPCSKAGYLYAIDVEIVNGGIPYGDSFYLIAHYCLHKISDSQTAMAVYTQIKYRKSVWGLVKGMIEKNSWQGLEDFFTSLGKALHIEMEESLINTVKRKSRRRRACPSIPRASLDDARPLRGSLSKTKISTANVSRTDFPILIVFAVLMVLVILNILLYYKLWSLEGSPPYTLLDLHVLKDPPKSHEEWVKLLQQQETLHTVEMQKWQRILKTAIHLLRQTEDSLNQLQRSIHPAYTNKIMSIIQSHKEAADRPPSEEL